MRRLAVFASGSGTNFEAIATACERGEIPARVVLMVCDKPGAGVVQRAAGHGVEAFVFAPKEYASKADYEREIVRRLDQAGVELVCLAGYMRIVGVKVFGVTIHYVDATLDGGKIISQRAFGYDGDDIAELEARIHAVEYPLYIETINKLLKE